MNTQWPPPPPGRQAARVPSLFAGHAAASAGYAAAHFGKSLFWQAGELLLAFFLTEAAGLAPKAMGLVLALSLLASAASDLVVGCTLRRSLARIDGACRLQLIGACAAAMTMIALFSTAHLPAPMRMPFALAMAVMYRMAYSVYDLPQNVLLSLATASAYGRIKASSIRIALSGAAGLALALAIAPLLAHHPRFDQPTRFLLLALAMATVAVGSAVALRWVMRGSPPVPPEVAPGPAGPPATSLPGVGPLLGMFFALLLTAPLFGKLEPYFAAYVLKSPGWGGWLVLASALGTIAAQPLWCRLVRGRPPAQVITGFGIAVLASAGGWAAFGRSPPMAAAWAGMLGVMGGGLGMAMWAGFAEAATRWDRRHVGLAYGLLTATSKLALALGVLGLGILLDGLDYRGSDSGRLPWLMALGPALGAAGCIGLAWAWRARSRPWHGDEDGDTGNIRTAGRSVA